jgi:hypothetical protein
MPARDYAFIKYNRKAKQVKSLDRLVFPGSISNSRVVEIKTRRARLGTASARAPISLDYEQ